MLLLQYRMGAHVDDAKILGIDYLISGGVMHVIDRYDFTPILSE
jgi:hypothetical protein